MKEGEKKMIAQEKHPGRVPQCHKLAALIKKRKEEILRNKEQSTEKSTVRSSVQSTEQSSVQPKEQSSVQLKEAVLQYSQMMLMSMASVYLPSLPLVFVYFLHLTLFSLKIKKPSMKNKINNQNDVLSFRKKSL